MRAHSNTSSTRDGTWHSDAAGAGRERSDCGMTEQHPLPTWVPRVPRRKIQRLYESDAMGIHDDELIDDVGYSLLSRCEAFITANEARAGRAPCPRCARIIQHTARRGDVLQCPECGWELPWTDYFKTIQHKQLSGAEAVLQLFRSFVSAFPVAPSSREKMIRIDQLIHGFHWYSRDDGTRGPTRPVAVNLIEGRLNEVVAFLDSLSYGEQSSPGAREVYAKWNRNIEVNQGWYRNRSAER